MTETPASDSEQAFLDRAVVIALGSNLPGEYASSRELLDAAVKALDEHGLKVVRTSSWWKSKAWPEGSGPDFLNGVALLEPEVVAREVLRRLHVIELLFGRTRFQRNSARTLDLDLIAWGRKIIRSPHLTVPHPRALQRGFVMMPLASIAPTWTHPHGSETSIILAERCAVGLDVVPA